MDMEKEQDKSAYTALAWIYDRLNREIDYERWADFVEECFRRHSKIPVELMLDLACGTGRMTTVLRSRGYDMIGIDGSADMLNEAFLRSENMDILYLQQDMRDFELYGTVSAVTCCLDSMNYLVDDGDLVRAIRNIRLYLEPGGLFLFDMNTPYKFEHVYGNEAYIFDDELPAETTEDGETLPPVPVYCGWQNSYDKDTKRCDFLLSIFLSWADGKYTRYDEEQQERCYTHDEVKQALEENGFELLGTYGDYDFGETHEKTERWYFVARAVEGNTDQQVIR